MTTSLDRIKQLDAAMPIPKLPRSYSDGDSVRVAYDQAIIAHRALFDELAEDFVVQMQDADGIPQRLLDRSPASLERIDEHVIASDYRNSFKKAYLEQHLLPALGGYVARVCDVHLIEAARDCLSNLYWIWGSRVRQHVLQTQGGLKTFHPFAAAEAAIESGLPLATFYATARWYQADQYLTSITVLPRSASFVPDEWKRVTTLAALHAFFPEARIRPRIFNRPNRFRTSGGGEHVAMCAFEIGYLVSSKRRVARPELTEAQRNEVERMLGGEVDVIETGHRGNPFKGEPSS